VLSKCANPECSQQFRYLRQGRLFNLTPTPEVQAQSNDFYEALYERVLAVRPMLQTNERGLGRNPGRDGQPARDRALTVRMRTIG
jgi:hypothetical protein